METAESKNVAGVEGAAPVAKAEREPRVSMEQFVKAFESSDSIAAAAEKTGLKPTSVQARASKYRSMGIPLKEMPRGGGAKLNVNEAQELLAKLRGVPVDVVATAAKEAEVKRTERKAEREAGKSESTETAN